MKTWELSLTLTSGPPRPQRQCCWPLLLKHAGLFQLFCPWGPRSHWPSPRVPVPASQLVPLLRSWPPTVYSQHSSQNDFFFFKSKPDQITSAQMLSHLLPVETRVRPMASAALCHLRSCPPISRISTPLQGYTNMPGMCSSPWPFRGLGWFPSQIAVQLTLHILEVSLQMSLPQRSLF